ncbi:DUF1127 domain-containing protein [Falsiroseomonas sp. E2-1-a20]|uniref:DUF1127 domain-containing protein n=1 Tax=Falsiroseomonas sp. E2-1-a20 TaxID=3239300 RepID=UPI003F406415
MDARQSLEQVTLFSYPTPDRASREIEVLRHAAIRARDQAIADGIRHFFASLGRGLVFLGTTIRSWPDRRRTYENLRALTDRELADIGLVRGEISRVFEPDFRMPARPAANGNRAPVGATAAA